MLSGSAASSPTTRDVNLYCRGASSSFQAAASTRNVVFSATPVAGTTITDPSPGGVFSASVAKAAAAPLASVTSSRKVYVYPVSSALGDSTRFFAVSEVEEMNDSPELAMVPSRSTAVEVPSSSFTRVADQSSARVSGAASEVTVAIRRATSPALTLFPGRGGMDTLGGAPVAPAAALTTVTLLSRVALLAPLVATSAMVYVCPVPAAPRSCSDSIRASSGRSMT